VFWLVEIVVLATELIFLIIYIRTLVVGVCFVFKAVLVKLIAPSIGSGRKHIYIARRVDTGGTTTTIHGIIEVSCLSLSRWLLKYHVGVINRFHHHRHSLIRLVS
jgi:hypothetical protein